jgi:predicted signal transduction protein with EAL and GGDEF domain
VDPLTGVAGEEQLELALSRARRSGATVNVAMLDLDHFKRFNDRNGHPAGDRLLKEAAAVWRSLLRPSDLLARCGGEEFAVLLEALTPTAAGQAVERLAPGLPIGQTFSAGVAAWDGVEAPSSSSTAPTGLCPWPSAPAVTGSSSSTRSPWSSPVPDLPVVHGSSSTGSGLPPTTGCRARSPGAGWP